MGSSTPDGHFGSFQNADANYPLNYLIIAPSRLNRKKTAPAKICQKERPGSSFRAFATL
jgi:hypothetical protein